MPQNQMTGSEPAGSESGLEAIKNSILFPATNPTRMISLILWPISLAMVIHRSLILGVNGDRTNDFKPVYYAALHFLRSQPVYTEDYNTVDPHYLYPPPGTMILSPLAYLPYEDARWIFIGASTICLVICALLLAKLFGFAPTSWVAPVVLFFTFSTETVAHTLIFTNVNGFMLLAELLFMMFLLKRWDWWAGVPIGLTIVIKPTLAPLLLLPLLNRQWKAVVTGIGIPLILLAMSWPLSNDPKSYFTRTWKYVGETRDYYNSSISGNGQYFGVQSWLIWLLRIACVVIAIFCLWFLYREYRTTNELLWLATSSGVLLLTTFLVSSLGQGYYSMLLFPMVMTVFMNGSVLRNWPAWLGLYGCLTFDYYLSSRWQAMGRALEYNKVTLGWSLVLVVTFCVLLFRYLDLRKEGQAPKLI